MSSIINDMRKKSEALKERTFQEFWVELVECSDLVRQLNPNPRRSVILEVIQEMYNEQNGVCALTGVSLEGGFEVDHIIPVSYSGGNERANLRLVDRSANRARGNRGVNTQDLLRYLEDRYANR